MPSHKRFLLIEDEPLIAMMLEDFLDALDREVVGTADTVEGGLALVTDGGFDAAILDVNLRGGQQSWAIADVLAATEIPFILATGGGGEAIAEAHRGRPILPKPFTMDEVERTIATL